MNNLKNDCVRTDVTLSTPKRKFLSGLPCLCLFSVMPSCCQSPCPTCEIIPPLLLTHICFLKDGAPVETHLCSQSPALCQGDECGRSPAVPACLSQMGMFPLGISVAYVDGNKYRRCGAQGQVRVVEGITTGQLFGVTGYTYSFSRCKADQST